MNVGLFRGRRRLFCALFVHEKSLLLSIGSGVVDCIANDVRAQRKTILPGVRQFSCWTNGVRVADEHYFWLNGSTWPDDGDIFSYVARTLKDRTSQFFTILLRAAQREGRPIDSPALAEELHWKATKLAESGK